MLSWLYSVEGGDAAAQIATSHPGVYGSTEEEGRTKTYEWESRGSPLTLSIEVAAVMGKQVIALSMIVIQVSYSKKYLMECDDRVVGLRTALACEWTKTYVRLFPLMAVVVSLMAASRFLLHHRMFYELLRHGSLLNFSNFDGYKDPLFMILVWCLVNACAHFFIELWTHYSLSLLDPNLTAREIAKNALFQQELNKVVLFYVAPSAVFMAFLFASYDTESKLVPLSKYIEEDPDEMRRIVANMPVLEEEEAARVVEKGLPFQSQAEPCEAVEAYKELVKECIAEQDRMKGAATPEETLGTWRLVGTQWPARILLDAHLCDERSVNFRYTWYAFSVISMAVIGFVFVTFVLQAFKDFNDVFVEGQRPDTAALIMEIVFSGFSGWLAYHFASTAFIPCTSASLMK